MLISRVQALDEFIALKERQINRLVHINENLDAILETEGLKDYILTFSNRDRSGAAIFSFWPEEASANKRIDLRGEGPQASTEPGTAIEQHESHVDPLAHLLDVQSRGSFGPG